MRLIIMISVGFLILSTCQQPVDMEPPEVSILTPSDGQTVYEDVNILVRAHDNGTISKVEFYVNGSLNFTATEEPYQYLWNTSQYSSGSSHELHVVAYDAAGNARESDAVAVHVNNNYSYPEKPYLYPLEYQNNSFLLRWRPNTDDDFLSYSLTEYGVGNSITELLETDDRDDTTYTVTDVSPGDYRYYEVTASDVHGLLTRSNVREGAAYVRFMRTIGYASNEYCNSVIQTSNGGYACVGSYFVALDATGEQQRLLTDDGAGPIDCNSVVETSDGGFILAGTVDNDGLESDAKLLKVSADGLIEWRQSYDNSFPEFPAQQTQDVGVSVLQASDGGFIMVGTTSVEDTLYPPPPNPFMERRIWIVKTDAYGNEEWHMEYGEYAVGSDIEQTDDGGYIITGCEFYDTDSMSAVLLKIDASGNQEWMKLYGGQRAKGYDVESTSDGGFIICGSGYHDAVGINSDILLLKTDAAGTEQWRRYFGKINRDQGRSVQETESGGFILAGTVDVASHPNLWITKTDDQGFTEWTLSYDGKGQDYGNSVVQTTDGGFVAGGYTSSFGDGFDMWIIKTDSKGHTNPDWVRNLK